MEDKLEEVIKQYDFQVKNKKRARRAILLDTDVGLLLLKEYRASLSRLKFEESIKDVLKSNGYGAVDAVVKNKEDGFLCQDKYGTNWAVYEWMRGRECDIHDIQAVKRLAGHLGYLHSILKLGESRDTVEDNYIQKEGLREEMERHNRELKRVRGYIRSKKQKNEMEIYLLNSFDIYYGQACLALTMIQESGLEQFWNVCLEKGTVSHGSYNYHNILFAEKNIFTTSFGKAQIGLQVCDLYDLLRKVMEKNGWNWGMGKAVIDAYEGQRKLLTVEKKVLYTLMFYPEKYWKLINFYYNGRKSWMPAKNLEKLLNIRNQEQDRQNFLEKLKNLLF